MQTLIAALILLSVLCVSRGHPKRDYFAHLKPGHRAVLKAWLERHKPWLRPAVEGLDSVYSREPEKIRRILGGEAHQFYSFGDFNGDGKEDFAVILVDDRDDFTEDCKRDVCSAFAIFNGDFSGNQSPAFYEEELDMIGYGYIAYDQRVRRRLYFGSLEGYYFCSTLIPKGGGYEEHEDESNCGYRNPRKEK
jgi:hypothetical protein